MKSAHGNKVWGWSLAAVGCLGLGLWSACGADQGGTGDGSGGDGSGQGSGPGGGDSDGFDEDGLLPPDPNSSPGGGSAGGGDPDGNNECGFETFKLDRLPPELLLVLDRSSSMVQDRIAGETHWDVVARSVDTAVERTQDGVTWGLKTFPTTNGCSVSDGVEEDVAVTNYQPISQRIGRARPGRNNGTPTRKAVRSAVEYLQSRSTPNPKYILLATDGQPTCFMENPSRDAFDEEAVTAVQEAKAAGFNTFVVGIAAQRGTAAALDMLNRMAESGGEPRDGDTKFYLATSETELTETLQNIAGRIGSCSFQLSDTPPSPDDVAVDIDGQRVARSNQDGWEYNSAGNAVVLHGPLCDKAKSGAIKDVKITFGCPGVFIPIL